MLHLFADTSKDHPIISVGYVLYRSERNEETLLDTGTRVINIEADERDIRWTTSRGEFMAAIVGTRAALDYSDEQIIVHLDNAGVVKSIKNDTWNHEEYFPHCLKSFLHRFKDWYVRIVHRDQNDVAHRQANVGMKIGRDIVEGTL